MDIQLKRKKKLAEQARNAEWQELVTVIEHLGENEKAFLREHPPGLVNALWIHFEATRDKCGCESPNHEQPDCSVRLIERLLLDEEFI